MMKWIEKKGHMKSASKVKKKNGHIYDHQSSDKVLFKIFLANSKSYIDIYYMYVKLQLRIYCFVIFGRLPFPNRPRNYNSGRN